MATYIIETTDEQESAINNMRAQEGIDATNDALMQRKIGVVLAGWVEADTAYLEAQFLANVKALDPEKKAQVASIIAA
jgi:hypothetical protein